MGGTFVEVPFKESGDGAGGYAKEMSAEEEKTKVEPLVKQLDSRKERSIKDG